MTTPAQFRTAVQAAIVLAGAVSVHAVVWGNAGQCIGNPIVRLFTTSETSCTNDPREVKTENEDGLLDLSLSALREVVVQIRTESTSEATANDAYQLSGWIEIGLSLQSVTDALYAVGIELVETTDASDVSFLSGDMMICARTFDARFRYEISRTDPTVIGVIEHVKVSGDITNPEQISLPVQQYDKPSA